MQITDKNMEINAVHKLDYGIVRAYKIFDNVLTPQTLALLVDNYTVFITKMIT